MGYRSALLLKSVNRSDEMDSFPGNSRIEGITDFGEVGYGGPAPPDKRHTYVFKLYALDCTLGGQGEDP